MSVQSEITRISGNVSAALAAIADKGVTVPDGSTSDALAELIASIEAGGGARIATGSFTNVSSSRSSAKITHGLGAIPKIVIILWDNASLDSVENSFLYIGSFAYQDGEFNDSVKMLACNVVYKKTYTNFSYCSKLNDVTYYNGFDIRSGSPYKHCSIYGVNENTFSVDTRLDKMSSYADITYFAVGGTYKWIVI